VNTLSIDPGGTTGMAHWLDGIGFESWEIKNGLEGFADWWFGELVPETYEHVVCEKFIITPTTHQKTRQYDALYIIGLVLATYSRRGFRTWTLQTPAHAKTFAKDTKLRHMKWYDGSPGGHANDASRHLLTFLAKKEPLVRDQLEMML
jgi:hypothetical protein